MLQIQSLWWVTTNEERGPRPLPMHPTSAVQSAFDKANEKYAADCEKCLALVQTSYGSIPQARLQEMMDRYEDRSNRTKVHKIMEEMEKVYGGNKKYHQTRTGTRDGGAAPCNEAGKCC